MNETLKENEIGVEHRDKDLYVIGISSRNVVLRAVVHNMMKVIYNLKLKNVLSRLCYILFLSLSLIFTTSCQLYHSTIANRSNGQSPPERPNISVKKDPLAYKIVRKSGPALLSFSELITLSKNPNPTGKLKIKLSKLLSTPFIDNRAYYSKGLPSARKHEDLGKGLRVTQWNVEKSIKIPEVASALSSEAAYKEMMQDELKRNPRILNDALMERYKVAQSDVLLLQEMDIGHCRSGYIFAAEHLAQKMGMNFVYSAQQLEVDPVYLGLEDVYLTNGEVDAQACNVLHGRPKNYRGVFGVAVLSRYPIKRAQVYQLQNQPYDWYEGESQKPDFLERTRKSISEKAFKFKPVRELKVGGRGFTRVDLHIPHLPYETLSVINVHLEIKATPKQRKKQMAEIMSGIREIKNPVVMAGDFNNSSFDIAPTSWVKFTKKSVTSPSTALSASLSLADITGLNQIRGIINYYKNYRNPLAWNIPVVFPNKVKPLFNSIEDFRFNDGGAFDFRGDIKRSVPNCYQKLSNSNQHYPNKGYTFTFTVPRPIGPFGRDRLDWIFVKSVLREPQEKGATYQYSPHFGETFSLLNQACKDPFSDHSPISTFIPFNEPDL